MLWLGRRVRAREQMSRTQHSINCLTSYLVEQAKTLQSHCVNRSKSLGLTGEVVLNTLSWCFKRHCTGSKPAYLNFNIWTQAQNLQLGALNTQFYKNRYAGSKPAGRIILLLLLLSPGFSRHICPHRCQSGYLWYSSFAHRAPYLLELTVRGYCYFGC
jgi:hypothetical protein